MKNFMASPTAAETTSSASSSWSIDVTGSQAYRKDGWGSYSSNSTSTIVCLPIFFDSGFIVKHFAPSQMSLAPASRIAHFGLAPPLLLGLTIPGNFMSCKKKVKSFQAGSGLVGGNGKKK